MRQHRRELSLSSMCRVLSVNCSGYYVWLAKPVSDRAEADTRILDYIRLFFNDSHSIYGSPRIHRDLRDAGIGCGRKRVERLMHSAKLRSVRGYKRPRYRGGKSAVMAPNIFATTVYPSAP